MKKERDDRLIEILFGDSEAASMKMAKSTMLTEKGDVSAATRVEGTPGNVVCLNFMLDIGDIKEKIDSKYRKSLISSMYAKEGGGGDEAVDKELPEPGELYCSERKRLENHLAEGEAVRVWYSDAPYSVCGFYYLCHALQKYKNEIHAVKLPKYKIHANAIVSHQNWGEISADEFVDFLSYEKELSNEEIRMYARLWSDLKKENSPLRAVINGKLIGVPEYFYDFLIWNRITKKPIKEARLIGDILGHDQIGIGDWWYAKRIDFFIKEGRIRVIEESDKKYARTIGLV